MIFQIEFGVDYFVLELVGNVPKKNSFKRFSLFYTEF